MGAPLTRRAEDASSILLNAVERLRRAWYVDGRSRSTLEDAVSQLTHVTADGDAHMVDVGAKAITERLARAEGWIHLSPEAFSVVVDRRAAKGDVLAVAQIAGIQGAKRAADLIPLCHPIPMSGVDVIFEPDAESCRIRVEATARAAWRTGVEMEALSAVNAALLTVYDMVKAIDRGMEMGGVRLLEKRGGRSGTWVR